MGDAGVTMVDVVEVSLHQGDTGVGGLGVGERGAHPGPGAIGADDQVEVFARAVVVVQADGATG